MMEYKGDMMLEYKVQTIINNKKLFFNEWQREGDVKTSITQIIFKKNICMRCKKRTFND